MCHRLARKGLGPVAIASPARGSGLLPELAAGVVAWLPDGIVLRPPPSAKRMRTAVSPGARSRDSAIIAAVPTIAAAATAGR